MKLNTILNPYKYFSLATAHDNEGILEFFKTIKMETPSFSLRYDRGNDFFQFAKEQSDKPFIFIMRNEEGKILGTAAIAVIPHMINGKRELLGYLGDLRISPLLSAKIRLNWKKCYREIIVHFKEIEEFQGIRYLYSAILDENQSAMRSLLKNNEDLIYEELTTYKTYNYFLANPFKRSALKKSLPDFVLENINESELRVFLDILKFQNGMQDDMGICTNGQDDELTRRLKVWKNFNSESFCVIRNREQKPIAVFAPWICQTKKLVVEHIDFKLKILGHLLPLLGVPAIKTKSELRVLYLTHLKFAPSITNLERQQILDFIVNHFLKQKNRDFHLISFFTFPEWEYQNHFFLGQETKGRFYQVMNKNEWEKKDFLPLLGHAPAFDIGIA